MVYDTSTYDVFLSYNFHDRARVEDIARNLQSRGLRVFLDRWYLVPGQPWPQVLERTLACCRAVAIVLGPSGMGRWQQRERDLALDRQAHDPAFPVIPVLLPGADPALGLLSLNTWVDLRTGGLDVLAVLAAAVRGEPPGPEFREQITATLATVCPYRGLRPFREEDTPFFCGREAFTATMLTVIRQHSLVAVVGASGSGKSSVIRAGLVPALRHSRSRTVWEIATMVPGDRPLHALAAALLPLLEPDLGELERLEQITRLAGHFATGTVSLHDVVARVLEKQPGTDRLLLLVDQWEELYTLCAEEPQRHHFLDLLLAASAAGPLTVVLTLRGDFYGHALSDRRLADRLQGATVNLGPMTRKELQDAIEKPATKVLLSFEEGLVGRILDDTGEEPGNLPLLEFVLTALWERRRAGTLHHTAYDAIGGLRGAIAERADAVYLALSEPEKAAARQLLLQLVRPGEGTEDTRQRAELPDTDAASLTVIHKLADARLVVTARDTTSNRNIAEVAHEALLREWQRLREWMDQDREFLRTRDRVQAAALLWEREGRQKDRLLPRGRPLAEAEDMLHKRRDHLAPHLIEFIEASITADRAKEEAERAAERRRLNRARFAASVMAVLFGAAILLSYFAYDRSVEAYDRSVEEKRARQEAERQTTLADQRTSELTAALAEVRANAIWSRLELNEVDALWDLVTGEAATRAAFLKQLAENRSLVLRFAQHPDPVIRALGLKLTTEQRQALLDAVLDAIEGTTGSEALSQLLAAVQVLRVQLTPEQALRRLGRVLDVIIDGHSWMTSQEPLLLEYVKVLASRVTAEKAQAAANAILDGMQNTNHRDALLRQVRALQALPVELTAEQAQAALARVLDARRNTFFSPYDLLPLAQAVEALPVQLTAEQAQAVLGRVLDAIRNTATPLNLLANLAQAVQALASKLTTEQAKVALREQAQAALGRRFLHAMWGTADPEALKDVAQRIQELPLQLTAEQMKAALGRVLSVIRDSNDPNALQPLLEAVQLIPVQLTTEQAQAAVGHVLDVIRVFRGSTAGEDWRPAMAVKALVSKLTTEQAQAALGPVLDAMRGTTDSDALRVLARLVQELAPQLTAEQAQAAFGHVLNTMRGMSNAETLEALALAIQELASKLATDRHQAQAALGPILDAVRATTESRATTDPKALAPLLEAIQELAPQLTADQVQAALGPVLEPMQDILQISVITLQVITQTIKALPAQLTAEQMQLALGGVLDMLLLVGPIGPHGEGNWVGKAIEVLAPRLTAEQAQAALRAILHAMFSRGGLGADLRFVSEETAGGLGLPEPRGAFVRAVTRGSPADKAKILADDVILAFDGKAIDTPPTLVRLIAGERPGKEAVVTLWRRGEEKNLAVILDEDTIQLGENFSFGALTAMAKAVEALPVQLTAEQAQLAHNGILKALQRSTTESYTHDAVAKVVETLAPKLTDEAKANMLGVVRSSLATARSYHTAIAWARAFEALLPPSPASVYLSAIIDVLKYPATAINKSRWSEDNGPSSATEYLQKRIYDRFPNAKELESVNFTDLVDWIAKNYPEIDLVRPPARPGTMVSNF